MKKKRKPNGLVVMLFIIALLPYFAIVYRKYCPAIFYDVARIASVLITVLFLLLAIIRRRIGIPVVATGLLVLPLVLSSMVNDAEIISDVTRCIKTVIFVFILDTMLYELGTKRFISIWATILELLIYANLVAMLLYPNGLYHTENYGMSEASVLNAGAFVRTTSSRVGWLLGHQTLFCRFFLPACTFSFLNFDINKKSSRPFILIGVGIAETVISGSATNYLLIAVFLLVIVYGRLNKNFFGMKIANVLLVVVLFYITYMLTSKNMVLSELLSKLLGRPVLISTRSIIWERTLAVVIEKPLLGMGYYVDSSFKVWKALGVANTHSQYFHFMFQGGLLALGAFLWYLFFMTKGLAVNRNRFSTQVLFAGMAALFIGMITDDYLLRDCFDFIMFFICYYASSITKQPQLAD